MDSNRKITLGWIIDVLMDNYRIAEQERIIKPWSFALSETRLWCYKTEGKEGRGMTCKDCKWCGECIMSAPDGNGAACKDFEERSEE